MITNKCTLPLDEQCQLAQWFFDGGKSTRDLGRFLNVFTSPLWNIPLSPDDKEYLTLIATYANQGFDYITCLDMAHCQMTGEILVLDD